jgi:hypothetical protein
MLNLGPVARVVAVVVYLPIGEIKILFFQKTTRTKQGINLRDFFTTRTDINTDRGGSTSAVSSETVPSYKLRL